MTQHDITHKSRQAFNITYILFTIICVLAWIICGMMIPELIIKPRLEAKIIARAKKFPELDNPRLNLFPVIYNLETHMISPFYTNFENCFGVSYF